MDWSKTVFTFPGQGSQYVGMAQGLGEQYPAARAVIEKADSLLGFSLSSLMFEGPKDELDETFNTQPALYVSGIAALEALQSELPKAQPGGMAGHSLGEFTALTAAGAMSFEDGLHLVRERGRLMREAGEKQPGAMAAVLGLDTEQVEAICKQAADDTGKVVVLANDNCPGQLVLSGESEAIDRATELAQENGAKKAIRLAVSIAAHSPVMESAAAHFRERLASIDFQPPRVPVYGNLSAAPLKTVEDIRHELEYQLTKAVRWTESMRAMIAAGAESFVEFGAGEVLTGLIKRIDRKKARHAVHSPEGLAGFLEAARA